MLAEELDNLVRLRMWEKAIFCMRKLGGNRNSSVIYMKVEKIRYKETKAGRSHNERAGVDVCALTSVLDAPGRVEGGGCDPRRGCRRSDRR